MGARCWLALNGCSTPPFRRNLIFARITAAFDAHDGPNPRLRNAEPARCVGDMPGIGIAR